MALQLRRNTAANATASNPVLAEGEPGFETDTGKFKIGTGVDAWNDLPYATAEPSEPTTATDVFGTSNQFDKTDDDTLEDVPGLSMDVVTATTYAFRALLHLTADSVAGWKIAMGGSCTASTFISQLRSVTVADDVLAVSARDTTFGASQEADGATDYFIAIEGTIAVIGDGTLTVQFAQKTATAATTSSVLPGSILAIAEAQVPALEALPPLALPDTFYVAFRVKFDSDEIDGALGMQYPGLFRVNVHDPNDFDQDFGLEVTDDFSRANVWLDVSPDFPNQEYNFGLTLAPDTYYVVDLKFDRSVDHETIDVTVRLDGNEIGTLHADADSPWEIENIALGASINMSSAMNRDFDYLKIGSADYGDDDLFSADFTAGPAPFDSFAGDGGNMSIVAGNLHIENAGARAYALKATT